MFFRKFKKRKIIIIKKRIIIICSVYGLRLLTKSPNLGKECWIPFIVRDCNKCTNPTR